MWTHTSTALEGNTLTLGETAFVIEEGLTVSGKPLKDHQEVVGHARAIDILYQMVAQENEITKEDLFALHKAVQIEVIHDIYKPVGGWKIESNGTYAVTKDNKQIFLSYAKPENEPALMNKWLSRLNQEIEKCLKEEISKKELIQSYTELHISFVRIHPFFDGNGRMARLLANLPVLKAGCPPIVINQSQRQEYIRILSQYEMKVGEPNLDQVLLPEAEEVSMFQKLCKDNWKGSLDLLDEINKIMKSRNQQNIDSRN